MVGQFEKFMKIFMTLCMVFYLPMGIRLLLEKLNLHASDTIIVDGLKFLSMPFMYSMNLIYQALNVIAPWLFFESATNTGIVLVAQNTIFVLLFAITILTLVLLFISIIIHIIVNA